MKMPFQNQSILPALRRMKDFEFLLHSSYTYIVLLETHISQLESIMKTLKKYHKKVLLHAELVQGLSTNNQAVEFLCHNVKPDGLISTRTKTIALAKQAGLLTIQRLFLLDSLALHSGYKLLRSSQPDYIEVLPGGMPQIIPEIKKETGIPVIAGGLVRTEKDMKEALAFGSEAVTTSNKELWKSQTPRH